MENALYYGDNLDVLRRYVKDETVDLVYLDPPFKSGKDYNVLFESRDDSASSAQIQAFEDTWQWGAEAEAAFHELMAEGGRLAEVVASLRTILGESDMMAYLCMMAPRLWELRRVLKATGSVFLHCDPTASHYLKLLMDAVFEPENFRNEIVWNRTGAKGLSSKRLAQNHDVILHYAKSDDFYWNPDAAYLPYDEEDLDEKTAAKYSRVDENGRRYQLTSLINPNANRPNLKYEFLGVTRVWRWTRERMERAYKEGRVVQTKPGAIPREKRYLDEQKGRPLADVWTDIPPLNARAAERLGYPTQKPEALLERMLRLACPEGGVMLDPFCGCGTAVAVAQRLGHRWIGIDITHLAIGLIKHRLLDAFGDDAAYEVLGEPVSVDGAKQLAKDDPWQFQWWILGQVGARPTEQKKGADRGIDGRLFFHEGQRGSKVKSVIFSVKAGKTGPAHVRDLRGVVDREKAAVGVLLTMQEPTKAMTKEAASAGFYSSPWGDHQKLQILSVRDLLERERRIDIPVPHLSNVTLKKGPRAVKPEVTQPEQQELPGLAGTGPKKARGSRKKGKKSAG